MKDTAETEQNQKIELPYQRHSKRKAEARELWLKWAEDYRNGISPEQIRKKYINKRTKKPYYRESIYYGLRQVGVFVNS